MLKNLVRPWLRRRLVEGPFESCYINVLTGCPLGGNFFRLEANSLPRAVKTLPRAVRK